MEVISRGQAVALTGDALEVGDAAPDAALTSRRGQPVRVSDYRGKVLLLSVVPRLGTSVCDRSVRRLEQSDLNDVEDVVMFTISADPWTQQARWADAEDIRRHMTLSDAPGRQFGRRYGLLLPGPNRLARAVLVVDPDGVIRHIETQRDLSRMPNFDEAEALARRLAREP